MGENIEQKDIQTPKKDSKQQIETLDQILESKVSDIATLNKVKPIFVDIQKNFTQPINDYIKTLDELEFYNIADTDENGKKLLMETIDIFLTKN
jgi:hypothetical protein